MSAAGLCPDYPPGSRGFVMSGEAAVLVSIGLEDSLSVQVEVEGSYSPDVMEMLATTARDTFRQAMTDLRHDQAEHE